MNIKMEYLKGKVLQKLIEIKKSDSEDEELKKLRMKIYEMERFEIIDEEQMQELLEIAKID